MLLIFLTFSLFCQSQDSLQLKDPPNKKIWKHYVGMGAGMGIGMGLLYRLEYWKIELQVLHGDINQYGLEASYNSISAYLDFLNRKTVKIYFFSSYFNNFSILDDINHDSFSKKTTQLKRFSLGLGWSVSVKRLVFAFDYGVDISEKFINRNILDFQLIYLINRRIPNEP